MRARQVAEIRQLGSLVRGPPDELAHWQSKIMNGGNGLPPADEDSYVMRLMERCLGQFKMPKLISDSRWPDTSSGWRKTKKGMLVDKPK